MEDAKLAAEIAEIGCGSASRSAFRRDALGLLERRLGYDGAMFTSLDPGEPITEDVSWGMDRRAIARAREGWVSCYAAELGPMWSFAGSAGGGVVVDSQIFGERQRDRLRYFAEVVRPMSIRHMAWIALQRGGRQVGMVALTRNGSGFRDRDVATLRSIRSVLALAEGCLAPPAPALAAATPIVGLSPREREVVELCALGYTNAEIALGLGSSVNTVRNQLHAIFRKVGATTRAELVGIVSRAVRSRP